MSRDGRWSPSAEAAFIAAGLGGTIIIAIIGAALAAGVLHPLAAVAAAVAVAIAVWSIVRLLDLASSPARLSLDCRDGRHLACLGCPCSCHQES